MIFSYILTLFFLLCTYLHLYLDIHVSQIILSLSPSHTHRALDRDMCLLLMIHVIKFILKFFVNINSWFVIFLKLFKYNLKCPYLSGLNLCNCCLKCSSPLHLSTYYLPMVDAMALFLKALSLMEKQHCLYIQC